VYGTVSNYSTVAGGTQTWDYTITYAGASDTAVGRTVNKGNILLDYGTSGSYYIERTVLDRSSGSDFSKVPYNRIVQWTNTVSGSPRAGDPDTVITVVTQSGNLANLTSTYSYPADPDGAYPAFAVDGFGFFSDNAYLTGEFRVGDLQSYGEFIQYNTTDGLIIKIGDEDDLSASVAELRQDVINIYLGNESSFSNIQFLSGQLVLKAGTGNSIASITLDGTQPDVSTISLDADFIIVTGTTIFKSAKDGSTTPSNLGEATFIDGGTIVTDSITATEINVSNLFAQEIEVTGKLKATDGSNEAIVGKLENIDINVQASQGGVSNGDFYGFFINANNYFGISDGDITSGNVLRVGDATNFLEFDGTNFTINTNTFDLTSGNLRIKSTGTTYPSASANAEVVSADVSDFRLATLANGFNTNSLAINNNRWVKFQFDYSQSVPAGSFTAGITVTLEVSTNNSTFTNYGLFSGTRIDFNTNYFFANNTTGNRLSVVDQSDSTKTEFKFTSSQNGSCTGTITMYFYVNEKDTTTHIRFNVLDSSGVTLSGAEAENIGTRDYNPITELNPSGIFTRLSDSLILSNGNTYIDYSLIT
jgi:hypothetical protein